MEDPKNKWLLIKPNGFLENRSKPKKPDNDDEDEDDNEDDNDIVVEEKNKEEKLQQLFIKCTNSTNLNAIEECISYLNDLPYEVIEIALKKTSEKNGGWRYAKTILQNWLKTGIKTVEQIKAEEVSFKNKKESEDNLEKRVMEVLYG